MIVAAVLVLVVGAIIGAVVWSGDDDDSQEADRNETTERTPDNDADDAAGVEEPPETEPVDLDDQEWAPVGYDPTPVWGVESPGYGTGWPVGVTSTHIIYLSDPGQSHDQMSLRAYDIETGEPAWDVPGFSGDAEAAMVADSVAVVDTDGAGSETLTFVDAATGEASPQGDAFGYELPGSDWEPENDRPTAVRKFRMEDPDDFKYVYPDGTVVEPWEYAVNGKTYSETKLPVEADSYVTYITPTVAITRVGGHNDLVVLDLETGKKLDEIDNCRAGTRAAARDIMYSPGRTWAMFTDGTVINLETGAVDCNAAAFDTDGKQVRPMDAAGIDDSGRIHGRGLDAGWFTVEPGKKAVILGKPTPDDYGEPAALFVHGPANEWESTWWFDDFVIVRGYRFDLTS